MQWPPACLPNSLSTHVVSGNSPSSIHGIQADVVSPCIGVCTLGPGDICLGCLRSSEEIANWQNLSVHDRSRIMAELPVRLQTLFAS